MNTTIDDTIFRSLTDSTSHAIHYPIAVTIRLK